MALYIVQNLIKDLNSSDINYCHWKSNEHLEASVNGDTDLDVLFDDHQKKEVERILKKNGFFLFEAIWYKKYHDIVDYIGVDKEKGRIVHVHTHFKLDIGEVGVKSYYLPWDEVILKRKIFNKPYNIFTSDPVIEYLLLVLRTAFKHDRIFYRSLRKVVKDYNREAPWLFSQINIKELWEISTELLDEDMADLIVEIRKNEKYNKDLFWKLKPLLKSFFAKNRVLTTKAIFRLRTLHLYERFKYKVGKKLHLNVRVYRRTMTEGGVIICLMGPDGAGKSTQAKLITKELAKKVDVLFMYMGSGKGEKSFQRKIIDGLFGLGLNLRKNTSSKKGSSNSESSGYVDIRKKGILTQYILSIKAVSLAYERRKRLLKIKKEKERGGIVLTDRYPQTETPGFNDGLKLLGNKNCKNILLRKMARYEYKCYNLANQIAPDIVVKFRGDIETLHQRRPEMTKEMLFAKQQGILNLKFENANVIKEISIEQPIESIKAQILNLIFNQKSLF